MCIYVSIDELRGKRLKRGIENLEIANTGRILSLYSKIKTIMKYKLQALSKIEKLENQLKALEMGIHRSFSAEDVQKTIDSIKEVVESLRSTISIEHDEWN